MEEEVVQAPVDMKQFEDALAENKLADFRMDEYDRSQQGSTFSMRGNVFANRSAGFSSTGATVNRGTRFSNRLRATPSGS